jgi:uncharacterized membrane protein YfcA
VPAFVLAFGLDQKAAVATSLAVVVLTGLSGTLSNITSKAGLIDWKLVLAVAGGAVVAAWFGSDLMRSMRSDTLTKIFGVLLILVGIKMLWPTQDSGPRIPESPREDVVRPE